LTIYSADSQKSVGASFRICAGRKVELMAEFLICFLAFYIWHALGVTVGYHRLLSHRSFTCAKPIEYFFVLGGYLAFEGSPIWWATIHRAHHRYVDTPLDPHSPRYGMHNAHFGWLMKTGYAEHVNPGMHGKDLVKDPIYRFLEQDGDWHRAHWIAFGLGVGFRLLILAAFGWVPALASLLAGFAVLQIPLMLNVVCHLPKFGYKTYAASDDSVNVWWVAVLALGEGWHNNHHASPGSAKTGMKPWEIDVSWLVIRGLQKLGLVYRTNVHTHEELLRRNPGPQPQQIGASARDQNTISPRRPRHAVQPRERVHP
jgi:sn-1 stearoyl-lipid 9-desaturase